MNEVLTIKYPSCLGRVAKLSGVSFSCTLRDSRFNSWSGHIPRLWVLSLVSLYSRRAIHVSLSHLSLSYQAYPQVRIKIRKYPIFLVEKTKESKGDKLTKVFSGMRIQYLTFTSVTNTQITFFLRD